MKKVTISRYKRNPDYFIVSGGHQKPVFVMSKTQAKIIANARRKVITKRKLRSRQ